MLESARRTKWTSLPEAMERPMDTTPKPRPYRATGYAGADVNRPVLRQTVVMQSTGADVPGVAGHRPPQCPAVPASQSCGSTRSPMAHPESAPWTGLVPQGGGGGVPAWSVIPAFIHARMPWLAARAMDPTKVER